MRRLQAGDPDAFDELYGLYLAPLYGYMVVALHDHHEAQDATHEVFLKMLVALPRYELRGVPFRVWLFRIARNHLLDRKARLRRTEPGGTAEVLDLLDERRPEAGLDVPLRALDDADFLKLVQRLPLTQRQVLVLRFIFDMAFDEIALALDVTPSYARNLQRRAFLKLRPMLVEDYEQTRGRASRLAMRLIPAPRTVAIARLHALY